MNLLVFEQDKVYVKKCMENGEIDYLEAVSEGAETEFFEYLNKSESSTIFMYCACLISTSARSNSDVPTLSPIYVQGPSHSEET